MHMYIQFYCALFCALIISWNSYCMICLWYLHYSNETSNVILFLTVSGICNCLSCSKFSKARLTCQVCIDILITSNALLLSMLTSLFLPASSVSLSNFILTVPMRVFGKTLVHEFPISYSHIRHKSRATFEIPTRWLNITINPILFHIWFFEFLQLLQLWK